MAVDPQSGQQIAQQSQPQATRQTPPQPPVVAPPKPYTPTPEEEQYLAVCAAAITAGCQTATEAAQVGNGAEYLQYANGVKAFTDAYEAIKNGGQPSRHQGA